MSSPSLSSPPVFRVSEQAQGRVTLASDAAARAHVFVLEEDIIRLLVLPDGIVRGLPSWSVAPGAADIAEPGRDRMSTDGFTCPPFRLEQGDGAIRLETAKIRLDIERNGLRCRWSQRDGHGWRAMAKDRPTQAYNFGWWDERVYHYLVRHPGERYYGLGERTGPMDRAGRRLRLTGLDPMGYDAETSDPLYKSIPYLLVADADGACHGEFYDTLADGAIDLGCEIDNYHGSYRYLVAESGDLDLYMIAGPDPASVTRRFTWLTGRPALMPRWALGYSGSTMAYTEADDAQARMAGFVGQLAEHDIGCGSFHLSSGYSSIGSRRYVFHWNRAKFPDPAGFVQSYRAAGIEVVPNLKPALLRDHPRYGELESQGLLVADAQGRPVEAQFWGEVGSFVDFTHPPAAAWWREQVTRSLLHHGIRATWNDNNEYGIWDERARFACFGAPRPAREARPLQALLMCRASRAAQLAHDPGRRPFLVTRSGPAGLHRYAQTWSGDNRTAWKTLRYNLRSGLGLALSGVSNSGHDVGGFAGPPPDPELLVRWIQAGIFMPRFSIHSWNDDGSVTEPWMYPEVLPAIRRLMAFRQTLIPCLYDLMWRYHAACEPVIRPLWHDFPADPQAWEDRDDHMLGADLLVALVCDPGVVARKVRLPAEAHWIDVRSGRRLRGGDEVELSAALDELPPLLARAGSAIPLDLAEGGFRRGAWRRGLWLFPPREAGDWSLSWYEDDGERGDRFDIWRGACRADAERLQVSLGRDGPGTFGDATVTLVLPRGEQRRLWFEGRELATVDDAQGRRTATVRLGQHRDGSGE